MVFYCLCKAFSQDTWGSGHIPPQVLLGTESRSGKYPYYQRGAGEGKKETRQTAQLLLWKIRHHPSDHKVQPSSPVTSSALSLILTPLLPHSPSAAHTVTNSRAGTLQTINQANRECSPYLQTCTTATGIFTHLVKWSKHVK